MPAGVLYVGVTSPNAGFTSAGILSAAAFVYVVQMGVGYGFALLLMPRDLKEEWRPANSCMLKNRGGSRSSSVLVVAYGT